MRLGKIEESVLEVSHMGEPFVGLVVEILDQFHEDGMLMYFCRGYSRQTHTFNVPAKHVTELPDPPKVKRKKARRSEQRPVRTTKPGGGSKQAASTKAKKPGAAASKSASSAKAGA